MNPTDKTAPASPATERTPALDPLLQEVVRRDASDLHLTAGQPPKLRVDGVLVDSDTAGVLLPGDVHQMARSLLTNQQFSVFDANNELDFSFGVRQLARFRVNCFRQRGCVAMAIRRIPYNLVSIAELGLPPVLNRLAEKPRGLVLVTGPSGAGKSTTLAALVDKINRQRRGHILTIEDPVEYMHRHRSCIVSQREVGTDTRNFAAALKHALRQDPDVILIGEARDRETIGAALTMAETGHLVFTTLHTRSAAESVHRIINAFPAGQQPQVRAQLASVLEGVVSQVLLPRSRQEGRAAAVEVMVGTPAIRAVIREDKVHQIHSLMQSGRKHGMQTMNEALARLYLNSTVSLQVALRHASDPAELLRAVGESAPDGTGLGLSEAWQA